MALSSKADELIPPAQAATRPRNGRVSAVTMARDNLAIARHPPSGKQVGSDPLERLSRAKVAIGAGSPAQTVVQEFFQCYGNGIQL